MSKSRIRHTGLLEKIDVFGKKVEFNFHHNQKTITNSFGGLMTIAMLICSILFVTRQYVTMMENNQSKYQVNQRISDLSQMGTMSMDQFDNSFNMFFGTPNTELNLLDN